MVAWMAHLVVNNSTYTTIKKMGLRDEYNRGMSTIMCGLYVLKNGIKPGRQARFK